jgi:hypothetical protein
MHNNFKDMKEAMKRNKEKRKNLGDKVSTTVCHHATYFCTGGPKQSSFYIALSGTA